MAVGDTPGDLPDNRGVYETCQNYEYIRNKQYKWEVRIMKVGIGYQNEKDAMLSGKNIAEYAIKNGNIDRPDLVLAFCSGQIDPDKFFQGLQSVVGNQTPIIGGSAIGVLTNNELSYEGYPAGIAIMQTDSLQCRIAATGDLDKDERLAGRQLAKELTCEPEDKLLLMFYDSVKIPATETSPPIMNASPPLISGIEEIFDPKISIIGAGVLGDYTFGPTKQFCGSYVGSQSVVGAILSGNIEPYFRIMHGCIPMDGVYHTITKIEGPVIYELDGKPIVEMIDTMYGNQEWQHQIPVKRVSIGVNMGGKYEDFQESHYVNRLITGVLPTREGIVIFEPDLEQGMEIQFMIRDADEIIASARNNASELMEHIYTDGRKPVFGLYIDCAGRNASVSETLTEEASEVIEALNRYNTPLLGFYSGVEVAPFLGKSRGLDWTGVLVVITKE
jgi:hypothetical protein